MSLSVGTSWYDLNRATNAAHLVIALNTAGLDASWWSIGTHTEELRRVSVRGEIETWGFPMDGREIDG